MIAIEGKRPQAINRNGVVFLHDNAKPYCSLARRTKLMELGWDMLPHPTYSPDLAPCDFCLFRSQQNSPNKLEFKSEKAVKIHINQYLTPRTV